MTLLQNPFAWRYWPKNAIYTPLASAVMLYGFLRRGKTFYCTAANPKLIMGGLAEDSKFEVYKNIPSKYLPTTVFIPKAANWEFVIETFEQNNLVFPVYVKPDIGEGGSGVEKIYAFDGLKEYYQNHHINFIIQNCIPYSMEFGVMVHDANGRIEINSLTERAHFQLIGDGKHSISELIYLNKTYRLRSKKILKASGEDGSRILNADEVFRPFSLGNWSYGATFIDRREWITEELRAIFQTVNDEIGMIHVGRYDILTPSFEALQRGQFQIVEINGIKAEVIHVFDPKFNFFTAYFDIFRHWQKIFKICKRNVIDGAKPTEFAVAKSHMQAHFRNRKVDYPVRNLGSH